MEIIKRNTDYAFRALIKLVALKNKESKSVRELSQECNVPEVFLRKILQKLHDANILESTRGQDGGYFLKKDPKEISVLEVIEELQGKFAINKCFLGRDMCPMQKKCIIRNKLVFVQKSIITFLDKINLEALAAEDDISDSLGIGGESTL